MIFFENEQSVDFALNMNGRVGNLNLIFTRFWMIRVCESFRSVKISSIFYTSCSSPISRIPIRPNRRQKKRKEEQPPFVFTTFQSIYPRRISARNSLKSSPNTLSSSTQLPTSPIGRAPFSLSNPLPIASLRSTS